MSAHPFPPPSPALCCCLFTENQPQTQTSQFQGEKCRPSLAALRAEGSPRRGGEFPSAGRESVLLLAPSVLPPTTFDSDHRINADHGDCFKTPFQVCGYIFHLAVSGGAAAQGVTDYSHL